MSVGFVVLISYFFVECNMSNIDFLDKLQVGIRIKVMSVEVPVTCASSPSFLLFSKFPEI